MKRRLQYPKEKEPRKSQEIHWLPFTAQGQNFLLNTMSHLSLFKNLPAKVPMVYTEETTLYFSLRASRLPDDLVPFGWAELSFCTTKHQPFILAGLISHICWLCLVSLAKVSTPLLSLSNQNQRATQILILLESLSQLLQMLQIHSFLGWSAGCCLSLLCHDVPNILAFYDRCKSSLP